MASDLEDWKHGGFGLYIHWPFCAAKCPYCDFNSHVSRSISQESWADAYCLEIERLGEQTKGRLLNSVFFGGGTPSLMDPTTIERVLSKAQEYWLFANDIEITLEANPSSVEAQKFQDFKIAGVNRVSMGIQALNDEDLRRLGRLHSASEALTALEIAKSTFERVSFDLIYARQFQTPESWSDELKRALSFETNHLSLYQLTIEENTAFGDRYRVGRLPGLPSDDTGADMYDLTVSHCSNAGLPSYEISNHAKPGEESKHNLIYWRYGDYVGIGPGAHGRFTIDGSRFAQSAIHQPNKWLKSALEAGNGSHEELEQLSPRDQACEYLLMGLRINEGISLTRLSAFDDTVLNTNKMSELVLAKLLESNGKAIKTTQQGRPVLNAIVRELVD